MTVPVALMNPSSASGVPDIPVRTIGRGIMAGEGGGGRRRDEQGNEGLAP